MQMFQFTEDQEMLRKAIKEWALEVVAPKAAEWDEKDVCPVELWPQAGEMGITGIFVPEQYGGVGMGHIERAICLEEVARYSAGFAIALMTHHLACESILVYGTEEQKQKYLPALAAGTKVGGLSVTEPGGGSDYMGQKCTAELKDGKWLLNGRKCFITNSHIADYNVVVCKSGEDQKGRGILTAYIVDCKKPGWTPGRHENKLGLRGSVTGDIVMNNLEIGEEDVLGKVGDGVKIGLNTIGEIGRAGMSAIGVGICRGCLEELCKFAKERVVAGKPISKLPVIQMEIAEIKVKYEASRLLLYYAAAVKDSGAPATVAFSTSKYFAVEAACECSKRAINAMGGYGVINEYPMGRFMRDALASDPSGATSHIQRLVIAADALANY